ncbi:acyltransferase [Stenotrophomonas sp. TWI602]|uniref:acyltransferase n=1 Tax=Stenotrophomonas sp. TWI602 TaxID=3136786 RepID=UPI003208331D
MAYKLIRALEIIIAAAKMIAFRIAYGGAVQGPISAFGRGLSIKIRAGGKVCHGQINCRRNLSIFCDGGLLSIGDGVFFNNDCSLNCMGLIQIDDGTIFGEGVKIYDHDHSFSASGLPMKDSFNVEKVQIGKNCWIGSNVVILKGVSICDGVTIGAGSVVTKSISEAGIYVAREQARLIRVT